MCDHLPVVDTELATKAPGNGVNASADVIAGGGDRSPDPVHNSSSLLMAGSAHVTILEASHKAYSIHGGWHLEGATSSYLAKIGEDH
jgi:hypothetical protein